MKRVILNLFFVLLGSQLFSQTYVTLVKPMGGKEWGYINIKGEYIIEPKFRRCNPFSEDGLAAIYDTEKKQFYFINLKGETLQTEISGFKLHEVFGFGIKGYENGMVAVKVDDKWGYLNAQGKLVIPAKYEKVSEFNSDHAVAQNGGKYFILDKQGGEIAVDAQNLIDLKHFSEQLAPFKSSMETFGFIDVNGKVAIQAQYQAVGYFNGGLAWAKKGEKAFGYINPQGEWVIQPQFAGVKDFDPESGLARVKVNEAWAYVNRKGEIVNIDISLSLDDFCNGLAKGKQAEKVGFYNSEGKWAIEPKFDAARDFKNGYAAARVGEKWGIIDKTGQWVVEPAYDDIKDVEVVK